MKKVKLFVLLLAFLSVAETASAQFNLDGQLLQRGEYRHGFGRLINESDYPAMFVGQRARIHASYKTDIFSFFVSVQDVRTWGNTPQIKATDPFLSVHEAWAETRFGNKLSLKLGRQELSYDNFRFLGNLDWALQARAHDFALLKYETEGLKLHVGAGFNQDGEQLTGNLFTTANQYKTAQFARLENAKGKFSYSILIWNNGLQYIIVDPTTNETLDKGIYYRQTFGLPTLKYQLGNTTISGFYYHQTGKDVTGRRVNAFDASAQVSHLIDIDAEKGRNFRFTAGFESISGTSNQAGNLNKSFSPLFGTNHMHNGYMDYFFVGGRNENALGLYDFFIRTRYDFNSKVWVSINSHSFSSFAKIYQDNQQLPRNLGVEIDLTLGYLINEAISIQSGYSQMFASDTFQKSQNIPDIASTQNWAYVMMIYRPFMKNKFLGLLF